MSSSVLFCVRYRRNYFWDDPWRWGDYLPSKRRDPRIYGHDVTAQEHFRNWNPMKVDQLRKCSCGIISCRLACVLPQGRFRGYAAFTFRYWLVQNNEFFRRLKRRWTTDYITWRHGRLESSISFGRDAGMAYVTRQSVRQSECCTTPAKLVSSQTELWTELLGWQCYSTQCLATVITKLNISEKVNIPLMLVLALAWVLFFIQTTRFSTPQFHDRQLRPCISLANYIRWP